jgi:two-component system phosphate regulon sensor histidine kinase PhoR
LLVLFPRLVVGAPVSNVVRHPELLDAMDDARTTSERQTVEIEDRVPVRRRLIATVTPLDAGSDPSGPSIALVIRDVSEEERLAQMRADFIANASHELRTPLASLRGFVETLQGPARNDEAARQRFLAIMATQAARMTRLIDDLLSLSRIEMRAHVPPQGVVDLNEVVGFVRQSLEPVAEAASIDVKLSMSSGAATVRGDRDELVQVFQNLIHNAIRYGREGGHVHVRVLDDRTIAGRPRISVAVEDNGQGIPAEHLPRLTERFYRVSAAVSREKGGTGLGLAIVKNIINRHRGELRIESEVGRGSTFTVSMDRAEPAISKNSNSNQSLILS